MDIKLYNSLTRSVDVFAPLKDGVVSMYHCGPTVYDTPHLGNYRTFILNDLVRRVFEYNGYKIRQVMNITDVDDKTINRSREEHLPLSSVTRKYEELFLNGLNDLNIKLPLHLVRATEHISAMIDLISKLIASGVAYTAADGVYMSIDKVRDYGALIHLDKNTDRHAGHSRISNDEYDKDNPRDFALWKFTTPDDGDISWQAPFGAGRPGWHIECSAMSMEILGPTIDIHTGGVDLMFPHHVNEIAQSEMATGQPFVRYWVHGAFMNVSGEKMAKSKGNFLKLEDLNEEIISPLAYRYWLLTAHYRSPIDFTFEAVKSAQQALIRLMGIVSSLPVDGIASDAYLERFVGYINNDLDMPKAIALVWEIIKDTSLVAADKRATILNMDEIFGLRLATVSPVSEEDIPAEIIALAEARDEARDAGEWDKADALRLEIENRGYSIADTASGAKITAK